MDSRYVIFLKYHKLYNDYVLLRELLNECRDGDLYMGFLTNHKNFYTDAKDLQDEEYKALLQAETEKLLIRYAETVDKYLESGVVLFNNQKTVNAKTKTAYEGLCNAIKDAKMDRHGIMMDKIIKFIEEIELSINNFAALARI